MKSRYDASYMCLKQNKLDPNILDEEGGKLLNGARLMDEMEWEPCLDGENPTHLGTEEWAYFGNTRGPNPHGYGVKATEFLQELDVKIFTPKYEKIV